MNPVRKLIAKVNRVMRRILFSPRVKTLHDPRLMRLGSSYGGWSFLDDPGLHGSVMISGGLGEDASFDVEFAARYEARICIVDPTPRAISHFEAIMERIGSPATVGYKPTGSQPPEAYELTQTCSTQFQLVTAALADRAGSIRFYAPPNPQHVSYSILNFQNSYSEESEWIEVPCIDIVSLIQSMTPPGIALLKLDIEGAETLAIPRLLASGCDLPNQVLVEFDELNVPSRRSKRSFHRIHALMLSAGYVPVFWDRRSCMSYALSHQSTLDNQHV